VSRSALKDVIDSLQIFVGSLDAPNGAGRLEDANECHLLNQIVQLSPGEQGQIVAVLAQLLVRRSRSENRAVADQVLEVLSARAGDRPTTERHARVLVSLLSRVERRDSIPDIFLNAQNPCEADRVRMAIRFLEAHSSEPVTLDKVAEHVGWSKWHCARVFKRHTGSGIAEFCRRVRVNRARRLLADRTLTIKEVAAAAGFTHPSDLTRCFLRAYGISPSGFRSGRSLAGSL
jgi:transcriptional regulator GlxA family with amidase domain